MESYIKIIIFCSLMTFVTSYVCYTTTAIIPTKLDRTIEAYNPKYPKADESAKGYCTWTMSNFANDDLLNIDCSIVEFSDGSHLQVLSVGETNKEGDTEGEVRLNFTEPFNLQVKKVNLQVIPAKENGYYSGRFFCSISLSGVEKKACVCGQRNMEKMVGGVRASPHEFPSVAGLIYNKLTFHSGATIVSNRVALTTARAIYQENPSKYALVVGGEDESSRDGDTTVSYKVSAFIAHEKYQSSKSLYNIGMIITENVIEFNPNVGPACVKHGPRPPVSNSLVEEVGWGATESDGFEVSELNRAFFQVIPLDVCEKAYSEDLSPEHVLCIYWPGHSACEKDFGGPVYYTIRQNARLYLAGIIANGSCTVRNKPDLIVRMSSFTTWVKETYPGIQLCGQYVEEDYLPK